MVDKNTYSSGPIKLESGYTVEMDCGNGCSTISCMNEGDKKTSYSCRITISNKDKTICGYREGSEHMLLKYNGSLRERDPKNNDKSAVVDEVKRIISKGVPCESKYSQTLKFIQQTLEEVK